MAEIFQWQNGDKGSKVKKIIETNFENINAQMSEISRISTYNFTLNSWNDGRIFIAQSLYSKETPCVDVYIKDENGYSLVYGGYKILNNGIELQSDIPYEGKVVIR